MNLTAYGHLIFLLSACLVSCSGLAVPATSGTQRTLEQLELPFSEPRLQVLITYNGPISTHAAVRLEHPDRGALFWDPAGLYGRVGSDETGSPAVKDVPRNNDVIWEHAPTLPTYWTFAEATGDTSMEVLEWRLSPFQAKSLFGILVAGAQPAGSNGFATATTEPFCAIAVSNFLRRFGEGVL